MSIYVGDVSQIPKEEAYIIEVNGISIGIFREKENYYAIRNVCPHKLAPICEGTVCGTMLPSEPNEFVYGFEGKVLKCPWHGWEFNIETGEAMFGISNRKVKTYPVEVKNGMIFIKM